MRSRAWWSLATVLLVASLGACGSSSDGDDAGGTAEAQATTTASAAQEVEGTITVDAAQSLSSAFTEIGRSFEAEHPGVTVSFNFAGSAALVTQLLQGAPADVFSSADQPNMDRLATAGVLDGTPRVFTKNLLEIVVAKGNPKGIASLKDLARDDVTTVLCAENVPCGGYAHQALAKAGTEVAPRSSEASVAGVLGRVRNGEADAGIVYVTDVRASDGKVGGVTIPPAQNVVAEYPHAVLKAAPNPAGAKAFLAYVEGPSGQRTLEKYGFRPL